MSSDLYANLEWLPRPADDFRQRGRAVTTADGPAGVTIRGLAAHALDEMLVIHPLEGLIQSLSGRLDDLVAIAHVHRAVLGDRLGDGQSGAARVPGVWLKSIYRHALHIVSGNFLDDELRTIHITHAGFG